MLHAENILKKYDTFPVLDGVNLSVLPGEILFLLGPSGAGKTTLLRAIAGLTEIESGKIRVDDADVTQQPAQKRRVGFVAQTPALWPQMSVRENIAFDLEQQRLDAETVRARVHAALAFASLDNLGDRRPAQLSAGETQRAALARALTTEPRCLLLDEPFSNLDPRTRREMFSEVRRIARDAGGCTICATHDWRQALAFADRVAVFSGGKILQTGTPPELYRRPQNRFVANFVGTANIFSGKIIASGAGEFLAETQLGEVRGAFASGNNAEPPPGTPVEIVIRPEAFRLDEMSPEENAFAGEIVGTEFFGETEHCAFRVAGGDIVLQVAQLNPRHNAPTLSGNLFAWVAPEDVVGIV